MPTNENSFNIDTVYFLDNNVYNHMMINALTKLFQNSMSGILFGCDITKYKINSILMSSGLIIYNENNEYLLLDIENDISFDLKDINLFKQNELSDGMYYLLFNYVTKNDDNKDLSYIGNVILCKKDDLKDVDFTYLILSQIEIRDKSIYQILNFENDFLWRESDKLYSYEDIFSLLNNIYINEDENLMDIYFYKYSNTKNNLIEKNIQVQNLDTSDILSLDDDKYYSNEYINNKKNEIFDKIKIDDENIQNDKYFSKQKHDYIVELYQNIPSYENINITKKNIYFTKFHNEENIFSSFQTNISLLNNSDIPYIFKITKTSNNKYQQLSTSNININIYLEKYINDKLFDIYTIYKKEYKNLLFSKELLLNGYLKNEDLSKILYTTNNDIKDISTVKFILKCDINFMSKINEIDENFSYSLKGNQSMCSNLYISKDDTLYKIKDDMTEIEYSQKFNINKIKQDMVKINNYIYIIGGDTNKDSTDILKYDEYTNKFKTISYYPIPVIGNKCQKINSKIYSLGGYNVLQKKYINDLYEIGKDNKIQLISDNISQFEGSLEFYDIISSDKYIYLIQINTINSTLNIFTFDSLNIKWKNILSVSLKDYDFIEKTSYNIKTHDNVFNGNIYFQNYKHLYKYNINTNSIEIMFNKNIFIQNYYEDFCMSDNNLNELYIHGFGNKLLKINVDKQFINTYDYMDYAFNTNFSLINQDEKYF